MIMVVLPDSAKDALRGINQDLSNDQPYSAMRYEFGGHVEKSAP
jgi:6-phosphogluconate dehydrogenase (decarboxylating)